MLVATIVIWAFNITVTRYVLTHGFQPLAYGAIRYGRRRCSPSRSRSRSSGSLRVVAGGASALIGAAAVFLLVNQFSFVYALKLGSATTVALILGTTPIFAAIIASLVGLERLDRAVLDRDRDRLRRRRARRRSARAATSRPISAATCSRSLLAISWAGVLGDDRAADAALLAVPDQRGRPAA